MVEFLEGLFANPKELVGAQGMLQLLILMVAYGYGLGQASLAISKGTELLLLLPEFGGLIGSVVLPVLGAVPDGAFILFSGLGPDAQDQLAIGVGALAGSTVLLVTVTWALSIMYGRVTLDESGKGAYMADVKLQPSEKWNMTSTGINCHHSIKNSARIMIATSLAYLIIQGPAFAEDCGRGTVCSRKGEQHWWAFSGILLCLTAFGAYLGYQVRLHNQLSHKQFEDDAEEEEERLELIPAHVLPEALRTSTDLEQRSYVKKHAYKLIAAGLILIMVLTDPMVDALEVLSKRINVGAFYVAFILAPLASSSLEVIAACRYAAKKTVKTSTISLASIVGAVCMNNTFCLAIFLVLVFVKRLAWEFAAETLCIMAVQLIVGIIAQRTTFRLTHAVLILSLYPISILSVIIMEWYGLN